MADGEDCTCEAFTYLECCCNADWTPQIVYDQQARIKQLEKALNAIKECESKGQARRIAIQALS